MFISTRITRIFSKSASPVARISRSRERQRKTRTVRNGHTSICKDNSVHLLNLNIQKQRLSPHSPHKDTHYIYINTSPHATNSSFRATFPSFRVTFSPLTPIVSQKQKHLKRTKKAPSPKVRNFAPKLEILIFYFHTKIDFTQRKNSPIHAVRHIGETFNFPAARHEARI